MGGNHGPQVGPQLGNSTFYIIRHYDTHKGLLKMTYL